MPPFPTPTGYRSGRFAAPTSRGPITKRLLRLAGPGPVVIVLHEAPGISPSTLDIASRLHDLGYDLVLPELLVPPRVPGPLRGVAGMLNLCIAREMGAFASGQTSAIVDWLRALARHEAEVSGKRVAVIGMCFSGGFALGTVLEPTVAAAVISQPAVPFGFGRTRARDLAVSDDDLARIQADRGTGSCLRVMRYALDWKSPAVRFERFRAAFPDAESCEVPTADRDDHSVLRDAARATDGDLLAVFEATAAFLARHLRTAG